MGSDSGVIVGVDVSQVGRIDSLSLRRPQFLTKFFSPEERAYCAGRPERLAARWAAKEAVRKVFGSAGWQVPLYSRIAVTRRPGGAPAVLVEGAVVPGLEVSLSHDAGLGIAVATMPSQGRGAPRPGSRFPKELVLPDRPNDGNKGTFGTVVILAGSPRFPGAAGLCSLGALRGGAGKVQAVVSLAGGGSELPLEVIRLGVSTPDGGFGAEAVAEISEELEASRAVVCGPGLGGSSETSKLLAALFDWARNSSRGLVLDADALNVCSRDQALRRRIPAQSVLTPHPLEAARLGGVEVGEIQADREGWARRLSRQLDAVVVLKGAATVVAAPDGELWVDVHSTPALASGGTGDVLAGLLGALIAQGLPPFPAAQSAVYLHGEAGQRLGSSRGRAGILASEVAGALVEVQEIARRQQEWAVARSRP